MRIARSGHAPAVACPLVTPVFVPGLDLAEAYHPTARASAPVCHRTSAASRRLARAARAALAWYPDDVWRWMVGVQRHLIGNAQPLRGRCLELGDVRGAALLTARLAGLVMELAFLLERLYRPYDTWLGTAFARLDAAAGRLADAYRAEPATAAAQRR